MSKMKDIITIITTMPNCIINKPIDISHHPLKEKFTDDMIEFYNLCNGISFFIDKYEPIHILPINDIYPANNEFFTEEIVALERKYNQYDEWICNNWFLIASLENSNYIVIDFSSNKKGKCYLALWDSYAVEGESPILAYSFTELLENILQYNQDEWFWKQSSFIEKQMGDAYSN